MSKLRDYYPLMIESAAAAAAVARKKNKENKKKKELAEIRLVQWDLKCLQLFKKRYVIISR